MREFIGHKVKVAVEEVGVVSGTVTSDTQLFLFVKGDDGKITRIVKSKICAFTPLDFEPHKYLPFFVLRCKNDKTGCPGVQFIKPEGFSQDDFKTFMEPCPSRCDTCTYGSMGELRTVDGEFMRKIFKDIMFGDYPEPKKGKTSAKPSARPSAAVGSGAAEGAGVHGGEEQS